MPSPACELHQHLYWSERHRAWLGMYPIAGAAGTPAWVQVSFRLRNDDGSESAATWVAAINTNASLNVDTNYRVRFGVHNAGTASGDLVAQLQYNLASAGWNNVSGSSSVVRASLSTHFADDAATTEQMGGARTFLTAEPGMDEDNGRAGELGVNIQDVTEEWEVEYCFQIRSADVTNGQTLQLRLVNTATAFTTYTNTPTITVIEASPLPPRSLNVNQAVTRASYW